MVKINKLGPLLDVLLDIKRWFETERVKGMIIGGVAASMLGRPRFTRDVDVLIQLDENRWSEFIFQAEGYNFSPRIRDSLEFAHKARIFLMKHKPTHIDVDVALAALPFEVDSILNATEVEIGGLKLLLPQPEDLVIMKAIAARPKDLLDIDSIIDANPNLEFKRIRKMVREFAIAIDMPDILENLEDILAKHKQ